MKETTVKEFNSMGLARASRVERTATVTLPVEVLQVVFAMQRARNLGQEQVLVRLLTWQIEVDTGD